MATGKLCDGGSANGLTNAAFQVGFKLELLMAVKQCVKHIKQVKRRKNKRLARGGHESQGRESCKQKYTAFLCTVVI